MGVSGTESFDKSGFFGDLIRSAAVRFERDVDHVLDVFFLGVVRAEANDDVADVFRTRPEAISALIRFH
jgi:hypothetical protein